MGCGYYFFGFIIWFVGGGVKGGIVYGIFDEFGWYVVEDKVYVYDFYVIIFYLMGLDYESFIYCFGGCDFCLMDVFGMVICNFFV